MAQYQSASRFASLGLIVLFTSCRDRLVLHVLNHAQTLPPLPVLSIVLREL